MLGDSRIPLPNGWPERVRSGVLPAISLAHFSPTYTRSWAANRRRAIPEGLSEVREVLAKSESAAVPNSAKQIGIVPDAPEGWLSIR